MPLHRLLESAAFGQDDIERIVWAFKAASVDLGVSDYASPLAEPLAKAIFKLAEDGERDPQRMRRIAVAEIRTVLHVDASDADAAADDARQTAPVSRKLVERRYRELLSYLKTVSG